MNFQKASSVLVCIAVTFSLLLGCISAASAEGVTEFYLSDASASKGRLFSITLCIENGEGVASFVAEIGYIGEALEYRGASAGDGGEVYVNSSEEGTLTLVFLCEEGVTSYSKTELLSLEFKASTAESSELTFCVRDVIDREGMDVDFSVREEALVTVDASEAAKSQSELSQKKEKATGITADSQVFSTENNTEKTTGTVNILGRDINLAALISVAVLSVFVIVLAVWLAYRLGMKKQKKLDFASMTLLKESEKLEETKLEYKEEERN